MRTASAFVLLLLGAVTAVAQDNPGTGAHLPAQAAADVMRQTANTDVAFLPAAYVNGSYQQNNLASLVQFPTEKIAVLNLTGADLRKALQRSVSLYPMENSSFLQISGLTVDF